MSGLGLGIGWRGNVRAAMADLPVPLASEPIATLVEWPNANLDEGAFLTELLERTDALLLLDVANLYASARNHGGDAGALLDRLPLERVAYVHVAGGAETDGLYHDTHAHPVPAPVLDLLSELARRVPLPAVMLERDHHHPPAVELNAELDAIALAAGFADRTRSAGHLSVRSAAKDVTGATPGESADRQSDLRTLGRGVSVQHRSPAR